MRPLVFLLLAGAAPAAEEFFRVAGVVVDGVSGRPLERVRVSLAPAGHTENEISSTTGAGGRFEFPGVERGRFQLMGERPGYAAQPYGPDVNIVTGPGENTGQLVFHLWPPAVIHGQVRDEAGEPVAGARVQLLRSQVAGGRRRTATAQWALTSEGGDYRLARLPAGTYFVVATGQPWYAAAQGLRNTAFAPAFFPNTPEASSAAPLVLKPGQEAAVDFTLVSMAGGAVKVSFAGPGTARTRVSLVRGGVLGNECYQEVHDTPGAEVTFVGVPPGRYVVRAARDAGGRAVIDERAIEVGTSEVSVSLQLHELVPVAGMLRVEGGSLGAGSVVVSLTDEDARLSQSRMVAADGVFAFPGLMPGQYRVLVESGARRPYLKSVTANGKAVAGERVEIPGGGVVKLDLVAGVGGGRVSGKVFRGDVPAPGMLVVLGARGYVTDSDGSFEFEDVAPGDYTLFATPDTDLEYAGGAAKPGQPVVVAAGSTHTVRLDLP